MSGAEPDSPAASAPGTEPVVADRGSLEEAVGIGQEADSPVGRHLEAAGSLAASEDTPVGNIVLDSRGAAHNQVGKQDAEALAAGSAAYLGLVAGSWGICERGLSQQTIGRLESKNSR